MTETVSKTMDDATLTYRFPGDVLSTNADALRLSLQELLRNSGEGARWQMLELDMTRAGMIDSVGLNLVVSVLKAVRQRGAQMRILAGNRNVLRILRFTRLDRHLELILREG